jgi:hypothetical protein
MLDALDHMNPVANGADRYMHTFDAGAVLLVRSRSDLPGAVLMVNELLLHRRLAGAPFDELLGILVGTGVDAWPLEPGHGARPFGSRVALRESVALSGTWSLCWFDLASAQGGSGAAHRRQRLLDDLLGSPQGSGSDSLRPRALLPVFTRAEADGEVGIIIDELEARYPDLAVGPDYFVQDSLYGQLVSEAANDRTLGVR